MYWHFLVKIDVAPIFCMNIVHCVHIKAERPILAKKSILKCTFQFGNFWDWNVHCSVNCLIYEKEETLGPKHYDINCVHQIPPIWPRFSPFTPDFLCFTWLTQSYIKSRVLVLLNQVYPNSSHLPHITPFNSGSFIPPHPVLGNAIVSNVPSFATSQCSPPNYIFPQIATLSAWILNWRDTRILTRISNFIQISCLTQKSPMLPWH